MPLHSFAQEHHDFGISATPTTPPATVEATPPPAHESPLAKRLRLSREAGLVQAKALVMRVAFLNIAYIDKTFGVKKTNVRFYFKSDAPGAPRLRWAAVADPIFHAKTGVATKHRRAILNGKKVALGDGEPTPKGATVASGMEPLFASWFLVDSLKPDVTAYNDAVDAHMFKEKFTVVVKAVCPTAAMAVELKTLVLAALTPKYDTNTVTPNDIDATAVSDHGYGHLFLSFATSGPDNRITLLLGGPVLTHLIQLLKSILETHKDAKLPPNVTCKFGHTFDYAALADYTKNYYVLPLQAAQDLKDLIKDTGVLIMPPAAAADLDNQIEVNNSTASITPTEAS